MVDKILASVLLLSLFAAADATQGATLLSSALATACLADSGCRAKFVAVGLSHDALAADFLYLLTSHGITDNATCADMSALLPHSVLVGLAMDIAMPCASAEDVADTRAQVFTTALIGALLVVAVVSFVSIFAIIAARTEGGVLSLLKAG